MVFVLADKKCMSIALFVNITPLTTDTQCSCRQTAGVVFTTHTATLYAPYSRMSYHL